MIPMTLTTPNGETKTMHFETKQIAENFINTFSSQLPTGLVVCVDAPLIGVHNGWLHGMKSKEI